MKFYNIALFMFCLNLAIGVTNATALFDTQYDQAESGVLQKEDVESGAVEAAQVNRNQGLFGDLNYLVQQVRLVIGAFGIFVSSLGNAVFVAPALNTFFCSKLTCSPAAQSLIAALTGLTWLVYFVGLFQLLSGRNIEAIQ